MRNVNQYFKLTLLFLLVPCMAFAQYSDHRNHRVDSLEQILATNPPEGVELLGIYHQLVGGYSQIDGTKSKNYAHQGVILAEKLNNRKAITDFNRLLALCYYRNSQYDSALFHYNKALEAAASLKTAKNSKGEPYTEIYIDDEYSKIYGNMGNLYNIQGKYHEAIDCYTRALKLFEKHDWKESQTIAYVNIGEMYLSMSNYNQAEHNFLKSDTLAHVTGDSLIIAMAKWYLSHLYLVTKNYNKALQNAEIAYDYYFSHPEEGTEKATSLNLLSEIYLEGYDDDHQAEEYARQALTLLNELNIPREKSVSLRLLSSIYLKRKQWRQAEQTALEALATDDSEPKNTLVLYEILSKAYGMLGNKVKSWEYFDKHNELQSSWSTKHYQSAIREMEVKYETEKKEMQIVSLETEKQLLKTEKRLLIGLGMVLLLGLFFLWRWVVQKQRHAETRIFQLEQEKRLVATQAVLDGETTERIRLARDLHDGLGSLLSAMRISLEDLKKSAGLIVDNVAYFDKSFDILEQSVHEMRRVAHHLMPDALTRYGLKTALSDFCNTIPSAEFVYFGDERRLDHQLEVVVYRIAHELINNALKHSGASHILVQIVQETHRIALTVEDDGKGFDPEAVTAGMGIQNIRSRVASFGGTIDMQSSAEEGTAVNVEFEL